MSILMSWSEWLAIRESNARKRAVKAALNGTGPSLPGSYAACPSTNPQAMDVAQKTGEVKKRTLKETGKNPDYSFDRWLKQAQELGNDLNKMVSHAKDEEENIDKKKSDAETDDKKSNAKKPNFKKSDSASKSSKPDTHSSKPKSNASEEEDDEGDQEKLKSVDKDLQ